MDIAEKIRKAKELAGQNVMADRGSGLTEAVSKLDVKVRGLVAYVSSPYVREQANAVLNHDWVKKNSWPGRWAELSELLSMVADAIENPTLQPADQEYASESLPDDPAKVFVVHGRNLNARDAMFDFLRSIDLKPLEWAQAIEETGKPSPSIQDVLNTAFSRACAVVILLTPDEIAQLRPEYAKENDPPHDTEPSLQARPNVLFEAGVAFGRHMDRSILVQVGDCRPFTDISGLYIIQWNNTSQRRQELAKALKRAGCPVNMDGTAWHDAGEMDLDSLALDEAGTSNFNTSSVDLSDEEKRMLKAATAIDSKSRGTIMVGSTIGGDYLEAGDEVIVNEDSPPEEVARYHDALDRLHYSEYVRQKNESLYTLTSKAYAIVADL